MCYTAHCTLHTAHWTLNTAHCTLHTAQYGKVKESTHWTVGWTALVPTCSYNGITQFTAFQCSTMQCSSGPCSAAQCSVVQYRVVQCSEEHCTLLHCTVLHCTVLHCTVLHWIILKGRRVHMVTQWTGLSKQPKSAALHYYLMLHSQKQF